MRRLLAFFILITVKFFSQLFYRGHFIWMPKMNTIPWENIRLMIILNHTSLYEPLFSQIVPFRYLWHLSGHFSIPGADVTLNRPIVGKFWKLMVPQISSITRKKDYTWESYLNSIRPDDVIMIAPEGRMKRPDGLDKFGNPMTVRGGVADIIMKLSDGKMLICLSGGLHHVQTPGQAIPKLFKDIYMNFQYIDIEEYLSQFPLDLRERKLAIVEDLQKKLETDCPRMNK